jgi:glycosyltransferase domain-containing protein
MANAIGSTLPSKAGSDSGGKIHPMSPRLTIVLPLKGRYLFTLRFLWHANRARLPYRFLIADGQVHPELARLLEDPRKTFPALDIEYIRYPDDVDFIRFFVKMADALQRVRTPYAMLADNDDFLAFTGLERSLDFLESNPDYVCCGGGVAGFSVYSPSNRSLAGLLGPLNRLAFRYAPYDRSMEFSSNSMTDRVLNGLRYSWICYAICRTPALTTIWREVADLNLSDLQLLEKFCVMRTLTLGKCRSDAASIAYLRQYGTSLRSAFTRDWVHHLVRSRFSADFADIITRISGLAATADGLDQSIVAENLREHVEPWLRDFLRLNYGSSGAIRQYLRKTAPGVLTWLKTRRRFSVPFERRAIFAKLRKDGASEEYIRGFGAELVQIQDVISGRAFREFIHPHVPKFVPGLPGKPIGGPAGHFEALGRGQNA